MTRLIDPTLRLSSQGQVPENRVTGARYARLRRRHATAPDFLARPFANKAGQRDA